MIYKDHTFWEKEEDEIDGIGIEKWKQIESELSNEETTHVTEENLSETTEEMLEEENQ